MVYDENDYQGLPTKMIDARNISTQYQYDNLNRLYQVTDSDGSFCKMLCIEVSGGDSLSALL